MRASMAICTFVLACRSAAQLPEVTGLLPHGGMRGSAVTIHVDGKHLLSARALVSGTGVRVDSVSPSADGNSAEVKLGIEADALIGQRELLIYTPKGISGAATIWVDVFPQAEESEPDNDPSHARILNGKPLVIDGIIGTPGDRDVVAFDARPAETWVFDCAAARLGSQLQPIIELRDTTGNLVVQASDDNPRIAHRFTTAGRYSVTVRDARSQGGPRHSYRLAAGKIPALLEYAPRGERPGRTFGLSIRGVNLVGIKKAAVKIPPGIGAEYWAILDTVIGPTIPFPLRIQGEPVVGITETDANMPLPLLPGLLDGVFERYPRIRFFFRGVPGERYTFDLLGRRIGSKIVGAVRILDSKDKEVAAATGDARKDPVLDFTPPSDAIYTIEARSVESKVGPDCFYRLEIRHAGPDFRLKLEADQLLVPGGKSAILTVIADRKAGYDGPIEVRVTSLPEGVSCSGATIPSGKTSCELTFTAESTGNAAAAFVRIAGSAEIGGRRVERAASLIPTAVIE